MLNGAGRTAKIIEERRLPGSELVGEVLSLQLLGFFFAACEYQGGIFDHRDHSCDALSERCALSAAAFFGSPRLVPGMRANPNFEYYFSRDRNSGLK